MDVASTSIKLIVWCGDNILMENNEIYSVIYDRVCSPCKIYVPKNSDYLCEFQNAKLGNTVEPYSVCSKNRPVQCPITAITLNHSARPESNSTWSFNQTAQFDQPTNEPTQ
jgi:hypothetical protein